MDTSSPLLTTPEVADLFSCAEKTVRKMAADGRLRSIKVGSLLRFRPEDLNEFVRCNAKKVECNG